MLGWRMMRNGVGGAECGTIFEAAQAVRTGRFKQIGNDMANEFPRRTSRLPAFMKGLDRMRLKFGKLRGAAMAGTRPTFTLGAGLDFREFRHYVPGDDVRFLDWNAYGRLDQLYLKQFETFGELTLNLVLDRTPSMDFGDTDAVGTGNKLRFARHLLAALGFVALNSLDSVRLLTLPWLAGQSIQVYQGRHTIPEFVRLSEHLEPRDIGGHSRSLRDMMRVGRHRHLVIVISDFQEPETWFSFLTFLRRYCEATFVFHIVAPLERKPEMVSGEVQLRDLELPGNRAAKLELTPAVLAAYRREMDIHLRRVQSFCTQKGIGYLQLDSDLPLNSKLWNKLRTHGLWE